MATVTRAASQRQTSRAHASRSTPGPVRLAREQQDHARTSRAMYVRRRLLALTVLVVAIAAVLTLVAPDSGATPSREPEYQILVVGPGDTVLDLVRPFVPEGKDPRGFAAEVLKASGVDARAIRPGAVLRLPRS